MLTSTLIDAFWNGAAQRLKGKYVVFIAVLLAPMATQAQETTYIYSSPYSFDYIESYGAYRTDAADYRELGPTYSTATFVTASITLSGPLPYDTTLDTTTYPNGRFVPTPDQVVAFRLRAGDLVLTEALETDIKPGEFFFVTKNGEIVEWNLFFNPGFNYGYRNSQENIDVLVDGDCASSFFVGTSGCAPDKCDYSYIYEEALTERMKYVGNPEDVSNTNGAVCINDRNRTDTTKVTYAWHYGMCSDCPYPADNPWSVEGGPSDSDGDGVPDDQDICPGGDDNLNADGDSLPDFCDTCPADANNDADDDGVCGDVDNCPLVDNADQADTDGNGVGDACNEGEDNDGDEWSNGLDNCPDTANPTQADIDQDSMGDDCDSCPNDAENDVDADGVCGDIDNCPVIANDNQANLDDDAQGDACDLDDDNDGVEDTDDNCPLTYNDTQADYDGDGEGDACDDDVDGDNVNDAEDACLGTTPGALTDATGCALAQLCPCDNAWKNHGAYVKCVAHTANDFRDAGLISDAEHGEIVSEAGESNCGHKN